MSKKSDVVVEGYSFKRAADAVGVDANSIRSWYAKFAAPEEAGAEESANSLLKAENSRLRTALRQSQLERDVLR